MKIIRASEVGTYQFCNRAWWYQLQGYKPDNQLEMARGRELHGRHFYKVTAAGCLQIIAYGLLLAGMVTAVVWLIQSWL